MKTFFRTIGAAFGMFSRIPVPRTVWNDKNMRYMFIAFPLVGLVIGILWFAWLLLSSWLAIPQILVCVGFVAVPILVSGGIHLDGYMDVSDAVASYASPERKRAIMNDPHVGAFAVIRVALYLISYVALYECVDLADKAGYVIALSFVFSRCLSGISAANFPLAKNTGLANTFQHMSDKGTVTLWLSIFALITAGVMIGLNIAAGIVMVAASLLVFLHYYLMSVRKFGGVTGDLSGWFLQKCEWWMLAALVAYQLISAKL